MSKDPDEHGLQSAPNPPATPPPAETDAAAGDATPGTYGGLRAYPSNPFQSTELPPPKSAVVELVAGAILGALLCSTGRFGLRDWPMVWRVALGVALGALDGYWVSIIAGRAGALSVWSVFAAMIRIPFFTLASLLAPWTLSRWAMNRDEWDG